uniref:Teretoxin Tsu6.16 n=1 Tax=Terebra subulata TaxID=89435 RepID=T6G_TERSU|nr:RecName: Full=Teretoxin Tsu6.16; Flags: Precursor [Terebra subulata]
MATSGRLLCVCLVMGLVFESLGYLTGREKRPAENLEASVQRRWYLNRRYEVDCGGVLCQFGCCEDDRCRELGCEFMDVLSRIRSAE